jgi:hypothetical protein
LNPFSYESELIAIAIVLYLYDSSVLLYSNEAILTSAAASRWSASWGWSGFVLAGKSLCMLNPFTPHHPAFRLRWRFETADETNADRSWTERVDLLKRLRISTIGCAVGLFVLLPAGLFSPLGAYAVIPAVAIVYGSTIVGLARLSGVRDRLGLAGVRFAGLAFECLACPPFSANMLRRVALSQSIDEPLTSAGARLADEENWNRLRAYCESRLDEEMQSMAEDSATRTALEVRKRGLQARPTIQ